MKKIITICAAILMTASVFLPQQASAQSPEKMSYQAVVRDGSDNLVTSAAVGMQISILQGSAIGTAVYVETQTPNSNANGLVSLEIGSGTVVSGDFTTIDWANGPYFIKTETDPTGGANYTITGTSQLLSVPYALHAENCSNYPKNVWYTSGNTGTSDSINFIGTSDNKPLNFKVNNILAGRIDHILNNSFWGEFAGSSNITGSNNVAIGSGALWLNKNGNSHIAIGTEAMYNTTPNAIVGGSSHGNIGIGQRALYSGATGYQNYAIGLDAMRFTQNGHANIAIGEAVLKNTIQAYSNIGIGYRALDNTDSSISSVIAIGRNTGKILQYGDNVIIGNNSMRKAGASTANTTVGHNSLSNNIMGSSNIAFGKNSLLNNVSGNHNVSMGLQAGSSNISGNNNLFLGNYSDVTDSSLTNSIAIGYNAKVSQSNSMVLGGIGPYTLNVGIGLTSPKRPLHIKDVMRLEPRNTAPSNPMEGDIYMNATTHKLMVFDGTVWNSCW